MRILIFVTIFTILTSCISTTVYLEDNKKEKVSALIKVGNGTMYSWDWENDYQPIRFGVIDKNNTWIFMSNNKCALYNYYNKFQIGVGDWNIENEVVKITSNFFVEDSLVSFNAFYSNSDTSDNTIFYFTFNSFEGFIPSFIVYDSLGRQSYDRLCVYNFDQIFIPKSKIFKIKIKGWDTYSDSLIIIPKDTVMLNVKFVKKTNKYSESINLKKAIKKRRKFGIDWYIMDTIKLTSKVIDGAKLLFPKTIEKKSNDSIIYLNFEIPH